MLCNRPEIWLATSTSGRVNTSEKLSFAQKSKSLKPITSTHIKRSCSGIILFGVIGFFAITQLGETQSGKLTARFLQETKPKMVLPCSGNSGESSEALL